MGEAELRGSVILGYMKFIKTKWGAQGLKEMSQATGLDPKNYKEGGWYPSEDSSKILQWIHDIKGPEFVPIAGNYLIKNLGILAYVLRFMNPKTILAKAPGSYRDAFKYGKMKVDFIGEKKAEVKMKNVAIDQYACPAWHGAFEGMLELTKTKGTVEKVQCQLDGAPYCLYIIQWE